MLTTLALTLALTTVSVPAQDHDHEGHDHGQSHDHGSEHAGHHDGHGEKTKKHPPIAKTEAIEKALKAGGKPVVADVLGVVCDFCAKAMNKTFGRRDDVSAVYVDLDTKTLNLVLKPESKLSDPEIEKLVKKAGYRIASIRRGEEALQGSGA
ncbi:cation transporter [Parvularcula sp. ZS-1/3]|uniref:Cation transporter n=1 Tax=Parvularcula mediterranea TaxID=2732508 RepID=A0A7Y3RM42_9PROT|nr:heavy-metal-associated domain-containing protein [Parvularcula mediterranea]NNU16534.1 cation transporter [Parvularcula mediterranea]